MVRLPLQFSPNDFGANYQRGVYATLAGLLALAVAYFAAFEIRMITLPGAQEAREAAIPLTTGLMLEGKMPYTLETLPEFTNVYGIVYNYAVLPAAKLWGSTFAVHRAASMVFLLAGAALLFALLRRVGVGGGLALTGAVFYYLFNVCSYAIVARPDTLGSVFYLTVVFLVVPKPGGPAPSLARMLASAALGVVAFYTKPYFALALGLAPAALLVTLGWRHALIYAAIAGALLLASIPLVNHVWPYYLFSIVTSHQYSEKEFPGYFWSQFGDFLLLHAGVLIVSAGAVLAWLSQAIGESRQSPRATSARWKLWRPDPWLLCLGLTLGVTSLLLGRNVGAYRVYYIQLVTPFAIIVAMRAMARVQAGWKTLGLLAFALNACLLLSWERPPWPLDSTTTAWDSWSNFTAGHPWQLLPPRLTGAVPIPGMPVVDDGQITYFVNLALERLPESDPAHVRALDYIHHMQELIGRRCFDIIVLPNDFKDIIPSGLLAEHYQAYEAKFPVYYEAYSTPSDYGSQIDSFVAYLRKTGPEHAEIPPKPGIGSYNPSISLP